MRVRQAPAAQGRRAVGRRTARVQRWREGDVGGNCAGNVGVPAPQTGAAACRPTLEPQPTRGHVRQAD